MSSKLLGYSASICSILDESDGFVTVSGYDECSNLCESDILYLKSKYSLTSVLYGHILCVHPFEGLPNLMSPTPDFDFTFKYSFNRLKHVYFPILKDGVVRLASPVKLKDVWYLMFSDMYTMCMDESNLCTLLEHKPVVCTSDDSLIGIILTDFASSPSCLDVLHLDRLFHFALLDCMGDLGSFIRSVDLNC